MPRRFPRAKLFPGSVQSRINNPQSTIINRQSSIALIPQHAVSGNDDPRNGLALTPDAHWMFDAGLWTAIPKGDDFLIKVAKQRFSDSSPRDRSIGDADGSILHFHPNARLRPAAEHLAWHRNKHRIA